MAEFFNGLILIISWCRKIINDFSIYPPLRLLSCVKWRGLLILIGDKSWQKTIYVFTIINECLVKQGNREYEIVPQSVHISCAFIGGIVLSNNNLFPTHNVDSCG